CWSDLRARGGVRKGGPTKQAEESPVRELFRLVDQCGCIVSPSGICTDAMASGAPDNQGGSLMRALWIEPSLAESQTQAGPDHGSGGTGDQCGQAQCLHGATRREAGCDGQRGTDGDRRPARPFDQLQFTTGEVQMSW